MGKKLTKHQRACLFSNEILESLAKGEKLSVLLQKSASLARLTDDIENQRWIDKEITASFNPIYDEDLLDLVANGRSWKSGDKSFYKLEHVEVLEQLIESEKIRLSAAQDPDISYTPKGAFDSYHPHSNCAERNQIIESVRVMQSILSKVKGRLAKFALDTNYTLNFSEIVSEIFSSVRSSVELNLKEIASEALKDLVRAYENCNSNNEAAWSDVASGCRRVIMMVSDALNPPVKGKKRTVNGRKRDDSELYRMRLAELLRKRNASKITKATSEYLIGLIEAVDGKSAYADKRRTDRPTAQKILIYTYLILADVLDEAGSR